MKNRINVEFEPAKYKPIKKNMPLTLSGVTLKPGINRDVDPTIVKHPYWGTLEKLKAVTVMTDEDLPDAPSKTDNITLLNTDQAKDKIKRTTDLKTLQTWHEEDGRKGVKELIARQISFINTGK